LRERTAVLAGQAGLRGLDAAEHAVDVGAADRRTALHDSKSIRYEDERGEARAELLGRGGRRAVETNPLALAERHRHLRPHRRAALAAHEADARGLLAEADEPRLGPCARREPLGADVDRLEQVRLADAVRAYDDDQPGLEVKLERGIGAEARERDPRDDQPASLIGMIR
jgi:hypothetical protein